MSLRWRDMDMLGHLNQAVYHELLEDARGGLLEQLYGEHGKHNTFVLVHVELNYRHEVRKADGEVEVVARLGRVGKSSLTLEQELVLPDRRVAADGTTVMVAWDRTARGKRMFTDDERRMLGGA